MLTHLTRRPPPALVVIDNRTQPILGSSDVHEPMGHNELGHTHRYLRHDKRAGRPNAPRSTSSTTGRSFTHARPLHDGHTTVSPRRCAM
jgi:hypothetical protein